MPKRSKFNLGSYKLLTCDMGYLVPIQIKDVIPGDIFRGASQAFIRMQPMLAPIMHPIHVRIHHYFVPYRLIWDDFEEFITKNDEELFVPRIEFDENKTGSLADYFGVPPLAKDSNKKIEVSALPFRAYNMIWNEYYRDADLQAEIPVMTATPAKGTFDEETPVDLRSVCWNKDYFTLARPWEQKGEEVQIPIYATTGQTHTVYTGVSGKIKVNDIVFNGNASDHRNWPLTELNNINLSFTYVSKTRIRINVSARFTFFNAVQGGNGYTKDLTFSQEVDFTEESVLAENSVPYVLSHNVKHTLSAKNGTAGSFTFTMSFDGGIPVLPTGSKQAGLAETLIRILVFET